MKLHLHWWCQQRNTCWCCYGFCGRALPSLYGFIKDANLNDKIMEFNIALIHGDGIGPEIVNEAKKVLDKYLPAFEELAK